MKILTGAQIKDADRFTIVNEPVSSLGLMERASLRIAGYICETYKCETEFTLFAGKGGNGGDGLAVVRILALRGYKCKVFTLFDAQECIDEYRENLKRLPENIPVTKFHSENSLISPGTVIIDAILGTGVKGDIDEPISSAIDFINASRCGVISIDVPSGMTAEFGNNGRKCVKSSLTLTLQFPKLSLLLPEGGDNAGDMVILPIGLSDEFIDSSETSYYYTLPEEVYISGERPKFSHKGDYGHALLICGSGSIAGAAVLATSAALRSGCGLVTSHVPAGAKSAINIACPSAMVSPDAGNYFSHLPEDTDKYSAIAVGPGLGTTRETAAAIEQLLDNYSRPMVIDADALNIISARRGLLDKIPSGSILTPHPGELRRLTGEWSGDREKLSLTLELARKLKSVIIIKGAYTAVCTPEGKVRFNSTGNPGMAKGGSGDVLTGILAGFLAQGMTAEEAAVRGVYLHGLAGDRAADRYGQRAMNSFDIIDYLF